MRAPYAVIILMNLVKSGFIAQVKQLRHTVSKDDREIMCIRYAISALTCKANANEVEGEIILFHILKVIHCK